MKSEKVNDAFEDEMIKSEIQEAISQVHFFGRNNTTVVVDILDSVRMNICPIHLG